MMTKKRIRLCYERAGMISFGRVGRSGSMVIVLTWLILFQQDSNLECHNKKKLLPLFTQIITRFLRISPATWIS